MDKSDGENKKQIEQETDKQKQRRTEYKKLEQQLKDSGQAQVSTSDPDSRHLITRNNIAEVAYNAQTTVDAENNIPIDYKLTNSNDKKVMGNMLQRAKSILRTNDFTALYDKGYHTGSELSMADRLGINALVAIPPLSGASHAPHADYDVKNFIYCPQTDTYCCPRGKTLFSTGTWHNAKNKTGGVSFRFKNYTTPLCKTCHVRNLCTKSVINGKQVRRSEYADAIENNKKRIEKKYKALQATTGYCRTLFWHNKTTMGF